LLRRVADKDENLYKGGGFADWYFGEVSSGKEKEGKKRGRKGVTRYFRGETRQN